MGVHEKILHLEPKPGELYVVTVRNLKDRKRMMFLTGAMEEVANRFDGAKFLILDSQENIQKLTDEELAKWGLKRA